MFFQKAPRLIKVDYNVGSFEKWINFSYYFLIILHQVNHSLELIKSIGQEHKKLSEACL